MPYERDPTEILDRTAVALSVAMWRSGVDAATLSKRSGVEHATIMRILAHEATVEELDLRTIAELEVGLGRDILQIGGPRHQPEAGGLTQAERSLRRA